jgi:tetratricopeptide (TPR) repeat protein
LSIVVFYVFARYRFPLVLLILLGAGGFAVWRDKAVRPMRGWAVAGVVAAAVVAYLPLIDTRADRVAHYVNIANALLKEPGTWDQAETFYGKALKESPRSPATHFGMATLMRMRNRSQDALVHFRTAVDGWPDNADLRLNHAQALSEAGRHSLALGELDAAAGLRPADPTAHYMAGQVLLATGDLEEAERRFERALQLNPDNQDVKNELRRASELREKKAESGR